MMKAKVTSKEDILAACRRLISQQGIDALNMREVASTCGIALGSIYNYFPSKAALLLETTASVWQDFTSGLDEEQTSYLEAVKALLTGIEEKHRLYPGFFASHPGAGLGKEKQLAEHEMIRMQEGIRGILLQILKNDLRISPEIRNDPARSGDIVCLTWNQLIGALMTGRFCTDAFLAMLERACQT